MDWEGYFVIRRNTDNLNEENWALLIDELDLIVGVGRNPNQVLHKRGNMDMFSIGELNEETGLGLTWYSNAYIYAANFNEEAVSFAKFKNRLVNLFGVAEHQVTYLEDWNPVNARRYRPSVIATYKRGSDRITVELMGCASDSELCTKDESNQEVLQLIADNPVEWGEVQA